VGTAKVADLREEVRDRIGRAQDDLRIIANHLRTNRTLPGSPTGPLPARHTNLLRSEARARRSHPGALAPRDPGGFPCQRLAFRNPGLALSLWAHAHNRQAVSVVTLAVLEGAESPMAL
jgi:hypothetical protein